MFEKRDPVASRREPEVAHVSARRIQDLADRILQPILPVHVPDDREAFAVGRPVGLSHVFEDLPRRASAERHPRERPGEESVMDVPGVRQQRELALRRDRKELGIRHSERSWLRVLGNEREKLGPVPFRRRAEDDRPSVRSEQRAKDRQRPKGQRLERHRALPARRTDAPPREKRRKAHPDTERESGGAERPLRPPFAARDHSRPRRCRHTRQRLEVEREVMRGVEAALGVLFQAVGDEPVEIRRDLCSRGRQLGRGISQDRGHGFSRRLPAEARRLMEDPENDVLYSAASLWEIAIKAALRKPDFKADVALLRPALVEMGFVELQVSGAHALKVAALPPLHKDPFDRMLVAQSLSEPLVLLTNDAVLTGYGEVVRVV